MNLERFFFYFLSIGLMSVVILLAFPKVNYIIKAILVSLTGGFWIYLSINFMAINLYLYLFENTNGILVLMSMICGIILSILAASLIMAFLIEKKKLHDNPNKGI
ncbi:MAG: hypothetical protein AAGE84_24810 [Cyanobacteria bacterium P01_G01_bin.39]